MQCHLTSMLSSSISKKPSSSSFREEVSEERLRNTGLESNKSSCWTAGGEDSWTKIKNTQKVSLLLKLGQNLQSKLKRAESYHESWCRAGSECKGIVFTIEGAHTGPWNRLGWFFEFKTSLTKTNKQKNNFTRWEALSLPNSQNQENICNLQYFCRRSFVPTFSLNF